MWETGSFVARCTVSREQASTAFVNWLAAYKYTPLDLLEPSLLDDIRLIYVPYFYFESQYRADYSVNVGDTRLEQHPVYRTVYENGKSKQVRHMEWRQRTEWRPYLSTGSISGSFSMRFADRVPQGGDFWAFVKDASWQPSELTPTSSVNDNGEVLPFTRSLEAAYDEVVKDALDRKISKHIKGALPGDTFRELKYWSDTSNFSWKHVYLPYWRCSFEYLGASHVALIDGRYVDRITGRQPTDVELRRSVNENLKPLWISLGVGAVLAIAIASIGGSAAVVPWLLGLIAVAVSGVGLLSYKRRHEALSSTKLLRAKAVDRLLPSLEKEESSSNADAVRGNTSPPIKSVASEFNAYRREPESESELQPAFDPLHIETVAVMSATFLKGTLQVAEGVKQEGYWSATKEEAWGSIWPHFVSLVSALMLADGELDEVEREVFSSLFGKLGMEGLNPNELSESIEASARKAQELPLEVPEYLRAFVAYDKDKLSAHGKLDKDEGLAPNAVNVLEAIGQRIIVINGSVSEAEVATLGGHISLLRDFMSSEGVYGRPVAESEVTWTGTEAAKQPDDERE